MNILFIGDIVGRPGREAIKTLVPVLIKDKKIDCVIANGENAAGGSGLTAFICDELFSYGVNVLTSGDHIWKKKDIIEYIDKSRTLLRPLNYPESVPGKGFTIVNIKGVDIGVINLMGRVFMQPIECPFLAAEKAVKEIRKKTNIIIVDLHAEATSEKIALGLFLDGRVSCLIGTHTHVQTADEKILQKGTAYITDCGMTGGFDGVIGRKKEQIIHRFITQMPARFEIAEDDVRINAVLVNINKKTGQAVSIERIDIPV